MKTKFKKKWQRISAYLLCINAITPSLSLVAAIQDRIEYKMNRILANVKNLNTCIDEDCNINAGNVTVNGQFNINHVVKPLTREDFERRSKNGPANKQYDLIIVGAGTSGSLLAFRMAERYPDAKILVLDVGQDDVRIDSGTSAVPNPNASGDSWGQLLRGFLAILGEGCAQWQVEINTTTNVQDIRVPIQMARGATLGGTSAINAQLFNRGTKEGTYDRWVDATNDEAFGFDSMVEAYKKIENRTQLTRYYGTPFPYWFSPVGPTPGQTLNNLMGTDGNIFLTSLPLPGYSLRAAKEAVAEAPLPGRSTVFPINQADVDENNSAIEYQCFIPITQYDQSDPNFPSFNPYGPSTPGYTYTPPADPANAKGPEYAGLGNILPFPLDLPKSLTARCYAAPAYLYPIMDDLIPHNVTLKQRVYVTQLLFDEEDPSEVIGVEYAEGPNGEGWQVSEINRAIKRDVAPYKGTLSGPPFVDRSQCLADAAVINQQNIKLKKAYAAADVWICAGAIDSPALLQRSGIGNPQLFESLRFDPIQHRVNLPGVGAAVQDTADMFLLYFHEIDLSTGLSAPNPAAQLESFYPNIFGFADPTNPLNVAGTASISGAAIEVNDVMRIQSSPLKKYADADLLFFGAQIPTAGSTLYQDIANTLNASPVNYNFDKLKPVFDRAQWGMYAPIASGINLHTSTLAMEYWDVLSQGQVLIRSGNLFERAEYSPNMLADDNDINAMANTFQNTMFPILSRMASKRYGPRGPVTYFGLATAGGASSVTLSSTLSPVKPIVGNIDQATYDTAGSIAGYIVSIVSGTGAGQTNVITAWAGAGTYVATVLVPWSVVPDATSVYTLNPSGATPLDSVEFNDDNHRNFVRFAFPHGDELFSPVITVEASAGFPITFTTSASSTRVSINQPGHGFETGDMIRISGITSDIDNIAPENFNEYHIVYKIDDDNYDIILFWNVTPTGGPGSSPTPNPAAAAVGAVTVFNTTGSVFIDTLRFDQSKFQEWLLTHYYSGWHPCCSCRMGLFDDEQAVVDTRARVYDVKGARVVDASIFPVKPNCNTQAPCYGIAQKIFDLVSVEEYDNLLS